MGSVDSWSKEGQARFKRLQGQEPPEKRLKGKSTGQPSKKTLMDRYLAARADLLLAIEYRATYGTEHWRYDRDHWYEKRFDKARQNCLKGGITGV